MAQQEESEILREIRKHFVGKWQCVDSENFEALLKEMGAPYLMRKVALRLKPDCEISIKDGTVHVDMISTLRTEHEELNFEEEVEVEKLSGKVKVRSSFEDGKIIQHMTPLDPEKKPGKSTRQINDNGDLALSWEIGAVKGTRTFSRKQ